MVMLPPKPQPSVHGLLLPPWLPLLYMRHPQAPSQWDSQEWAVGSRRGMSDDLSIYVYVLMLPYDSPSGYFKSDPFSLLALPWQSAHLCRQSLLLPSLRQIQARSPEGLPRHPSHVHKAASPPPFEAYLWRQGRRESGPLLLTCLKQDIPQFFGKAGIQI